MKKLIIASVLAASFSASAIEATDSHSFSTDVKAVCGVAVVETSGNDFEVGGDAQIKFTAVNNVHKDYNPEVRITVDSELESNIVGVDSNDLFEITVNGTKNAYSVLSNQGVGVKTTGNSEAITVDLQMNYDEHLTLIAGDDQKTTVSAEIICK